MTNDIFLWILAVPAGVLLGIFFFGGLWWTIQKGWTSKYPALWFFGSLILRTGVVLTGFLFIAGGQWQSMLACLVGFIVGRFLVIRHKKEKVVFPSESNTNEI